MDSVPHHFPYARMRPGHFRRKAAAMRSSAAWRVGLALVIVAPARSRRVPVPVAIAAKAHSDAHALSRLAPAMHGPLYCTHGCHGGEKSHISMTCRPQCSNRPCVLF